MVNKGIKDLLKINRKIEKEFLNLNREQNSGRIDDHFSNAHGDITSNLSKIIFELLNINHLPIEFPFELFVNTSEKISLFPHPRYIRVGNHFHDFIEIIIVCSGKFIQKINDETVFLQEGDICILHPNVIHSVEKTSENDIIINLIIRKSNCRLFNMNNIDDDNLVQEFLLNCSFFKKNIMEYIIFRNSFNREIKSYFFEIVDLFNVKSKYYEEQIYNLTALFIIELMKKWIDSPRNLEYEMVDVDSYKYAKILSLVRRKCPDINIKGIAESMDVSQNELNRILEKYGNKNLEKMMKDVVYEKIIHKMSDGMNFETVLQDFGFKSKEDFFSEYREEGDSFYGGVINRSLNYFDYLEKSEKDFEIIDVLQNFYEKLEYINANEVGHSLDLIIPKIKQVSRDNIFTFKILCIDICITATRLFNKRNNSQKQDIGSVAEKINSIGTIPEIIEFLKKNILCICHNSDQTLKSYHPLVNRTIKIISEKYTSGYSLGNLAGALNVNPSYLSRLLKKETGRSFVDLMNSLRIKKSKDLLVNTSIKITDIGSLCGFSEYAYFYQVFMKYEKLSPKEFRKQRRVI